MTRSVQMTGILKEETANAWWELRIIPSARHWGHNEMKTQWKAHKEKHKKRAPWATDAHVRMRNWNAKPFRSIFLLCPFGIVGVVFHLELRRRKAHQNSYRRGRPSRFKIASSMPAVKHIPRFWSGRQHDLINRHTLQRCDLKTFHVMSALVPNFVRTIFMPLDLVKWFVDGRARNLPYVFYNRVSHAAAGS